MSLSPFKDISFHTKVCDFSNDKLMRHENCFNILVWCQWMFIKETNVNIDFKSSRAKHSQQMLLMVLLQDVIWKLFKQKLVRIPKTFLFMLQNLYLVYNLVRLKFFKKYFVHYRLFSKSKLDKSTLLVSDVYCEANNVKYILKIFEACLDLDKDRIFNN